MLLCNVVVVPLVFLLLPGDYGRFLLLSDAQKGSLRSKPGGSAWPGNAQRQGNVKALSLEKRPDPVISVHI